MFDESERLIFEYDAGGGVRRKADPLAVRRALLRESGGQFFHWLEKSREPDDASWPKPEPGPETPLLPAEQAARDVGPAWALATLLTALDAQEKVLAVVRAAFGLPPFDPETGAGCVEATCLAAMNAYLEWLEKNARSDGNSPPTSSAASPSVSPGTSTTPPTAP